MNFQQLTASGHGFLWIFKHLLKTLVGLDKKLTFRALNYCFFMFHEMHLAHHLASAWYLLCFFSILSYDSLKIDLIKLVFISTADFCSSLHNNNIKTCNFQFSSTSLQRWRRNGDNLLLLLHHAVYRNSTEKVFEEKIPRIRSHFIWKLVYN